MLHTTLSESPFFRALVILSKDTIGGGSLNAQEGASLTGGGPSSIEEGALLTGEGASLLFANAGKMSDIEDGFIHFRSQM